ncbi:MULTISPECIES: DUF397 domain-containing protein [unclassified Streptomyces]|uniref:DUF397 domain-containing protein n=1 Tax=unclassified Streptomyces TaxID=2593676 RepID=UPI0009989967|nr:MULTISPECIES: DUF397 domain-containing protein [unclassified Streptomyces]MYY00983.1 DUF397 domain-containing protein [Streptomyces sp. SID4913]
MKRVDDAEWFKSSHSNGNGNCVEVAHLGAGVAVRDSKVQAGPVLTCAAGGWRAFIGSVVRGER